uniref:Uncharacterized protein n=1 Tax=Anopheles atroparvus TaxID=41427 RepID=A0A182J1X1_ANOAO
MSTSALATPQQIEAESPAVDVQPITSQEQLDELERSLSEGASVCEANLSRLITSTIPAQRIHDGFMLLVDRHFAATCSWRGGGKQGPQVAFANYINVHAMFGRIGRVGRDEVEKILRKKINNAKNRANSLCVRKSVARRPFTRKSIKGKDVNNNQEIVP